MNRAFAIAIGLTLAGSPAASAGGAPSARLLHLEKCGALMLRLQELDARIQDLSGTGLVARETGSDREAALAFGERIAFGIGGAVHRTDGAGLGIAAGAWPEGLVVKASHLYRDSDVAVGYSAYKVLYEGVAYEQIRDAAARIRRRLGRVPNWGAAKIPCVPILGRFSVGASGREPGRQFLAKPFVPGTLLTDLLGTPEKITPAMRESLREVRAWMDAVAHEVRLDPHRYPAVVRETAPFVVDAAPGNLVWIEDAAWLGRLGMRKPGFLFYEVTPLISVQFDLFPYHLLD